MALLEKKTLELGNGVLFDCDPTSDFVQIRMGEGKHEQKQLIKKIDLWAMCFTIADAKMQEELLPVRQTEVQQFTRLVRVRLKKDMRAGDVVSARVHISVPTTVVEGLAGMVDKKPKGGPLDLSKLGKG